MELFRDVANAPRVRLQTLGAAQRGVVSMADPAADTLEFNVSYTPPEGYSMWVSDIMRIELLTRDGSGVSLSDRMPLVASGECTAPYKSLKSFATSALDCAQACDERADCKFLHYLTGMATSTWTNTAGERKSTAEWPTLYAVSDTSTKKV